MMLNINIAKNSMHEWLLFLFKKKKLRDITHWAEEEFLAESDLYDVRILFVQIQMLAFYYVKNTVFNVYLYFVICNC